MVPLLRQSIYSRLAGYDDTNDAERLAPDPAMRVVVGWQDSDRNAASTRRLALPEAMKRWSLTTLQTRLIKTGGRLVRHARRLVFQLAEVLVARGMLAGILERISQLRLAPG